MRSAEVVAFGKPLELRQRPTPVPHGSEVLIRVRAAGVCHSDLHLWQGSYDLGGGKVLSVRDRGIVPPFTLGHEIAGEVAALGPDADGGLSIGQRGVVYPWAGCGHCAVCRRGDEQLCIHPRYLGIHVPGGYSDFVLIPHARYLVDFGDLPPETAAPYACSGLTAFSALRKIRDDVLAREPILLVGAGGLGLMALALLRGLGGFGAVVADIDPRKRAAASARGALGVVDPNAPGALRQARSLLGGGAAAALDFVGSAATARFGLDALVKGGSYVIVGLYGGEITLSLPTIPWRALSIHGACVGSLAELRDLATLVQAGRVAPPPIECRPLEDASLVLDDLDNGRVVGRAVLKP